MLDATLAFATMFATAIMSAGPPITINSDAESYSVFLIGPTSPDFLPALKQLMTDPQIEALKPILPYSVAVKNRSGRGIAATGVLFEVTRPDGMKYRYFNRVVDLSSPSSAFLNSGQVRFESVVESAKWAVNTHRTDLYVAHPEYNRMLLKASELSAATAITATLDFVVFDDGQFVGPDLCQQFRHIADEQRIRSSFATGLAALAGKSTAEIRAFLESNRVSAQQPPPREISEFDFGSAEQQRLIRASLSLLDKSGPDAVLKMARQLAAKSDRAIKVRR